MRYLEWRGVPPHYVQPEANWHRADYQLDPTFRLSSPGAAFDTGEERAWPDAWLPTSPSFQVSPTYARAYNGVFTVDGILVDDKTTMPTKKKLGPKTWWGRWGKLMSNLGVAHTAAVYMKEIHWDGEKFVNADVICS